MGSDEDSLISYITSSVAHDKYAFRHCGGKCSTMGIVTREEAGREYVNYCVRGIPKTLCTIPFTKVLKLNESISTLRRAILNGGLIMKKAKCALAVPMILEPLGPRMEVSDESTVLTTREEGLINRIVGKYPWTEEQLKGINSMTLRLGDDPIRMAIVDVLDARLNYAQLHSCKEGRDWRLIDGLSATLRSGKLYEEFNGKITVDKATSTFKGRDIPLSR